MGNGCHLIVIIALKQLWDHHFFMNMRLLYATIDTNIPVPVVRYGTSALIKHWAA